MREYRVGEKEVLQKKISLAISNSLFVILTCILVLFGLNEYGLSGNTLIGSMFFASVLILIVAYVRYMRGSEYWESLRVFVEIDRVTTLIADRPMVTITKDTVRNIRFHRKGITLRSHKRGGYLFIPKQLRGYHEIQSVLRVWSNKPEPVQQRERRYRFGRWQIVIQAVE